MVMHARKTQRMNDGYFEKHQAHPYQNSKYSSSKSYGSGSDRYERIRDSPNGNYRSDSPDSQSPRERDRSYQSKSSYLQKIREKERENRDYRMSRDKYSDCVRSPKDKKSREAEHRANNDRNDEKGILHQIKREERERVVRVGDWSEHLSSSGKKYYYNCKTEVSQWEKPREWIEREHARFRNRDRDRERDSDRYNSSSSSSRSGIRHEKHSNSRTNKVDGNNSRESGATGGGSSSSRSHWTNSSRDDNDLPAKESRATGRNKHLQLDENVQSMQDMDISPGDSTPTSEMSYGNNLPMMTNEQNNTLGPVLLANALPKLISHPIQQQQTGCTPARAGESSPKCSTPSSSSTTQQILPNTIITTSNAPGPPPPNLLLSSRVLTSTTLSSTSSSSSSNLIIQESGNDKSGLLHGLQRNSGDSAVHTTSLCVDTNHSGTVSTVEGPPTPTHSEIPECAKVVAVPVSSPPGSLATLQGMSSSLQALRPQGPTITPSLANHYRDDLVNHVRGWPAEIIEKQAQKLAEEAHIMGSIQCSKVSAELKSARSIVRLTEIQATLQEQRILFLRQQIKELEELKSQNSFMSDDS